MRETSLKWLFDPQDYELLSIVNQMLNRNHSERAFKHLFDPYLHPHGIKEMAAPAELRIAHAVIRLLDSLEAGKREDRLGALRLLRDEVMHSSKSTLRKNTARVLLQIMKELIRSSGNQRGQLELAHDFRTAASGKPRVVRTQLKRFHLLEMPEEWNQVSFDDHVHDANTKGRKSPTHLIMDAWIKGIRQLTVIHYNHIRPEAAEELLKAAQIMGIKTSIGLEVSARFRNRYVHLIWLPSGFSETKPFMDFLNEPSVSTFMEEGRKVSEYQQSYVLDVLREFNRKHLPVLKESLGIELHALNAGEFLSFVGPGQPSILHLAKFIHTRLLPAMRTHLEQLRKRYQHAGIEERDQISRTVEQLNGLDSEAIVDRFLRPARNPEIPDPNIPREEAGLPALLGCTPGEMVQRLTRLHSVYRITLNLTGLTAVDIAELLYECKGMITHLEIFNLKDHAAGKTGQIAEINSLQNAVNAGNVIALKRIIRRMIEELRRTEYPDAADRIEKLSTILQDISTLKSWYREAPLGSRIGSDSTGTSKRLQGMGLVAVDTLPKRAKRELKDQPRRILPVRVMAHLQIEYIPKAGSRFFLGFISRWIDSWPVLRNGSRRIDWVVRNHSVRLSSEGNITSLGGVHPEETNGLFLEPPGSDPGTGAISWKYLNTGLKNGLKILIGFIPAFSTFALTKEWWLLRYFGAVIWFAITGFRNILQSVLGGGGFRRSRLLRWNDYISWERISDSLFYTGFSVPLLDYLIKTLLLDRLSGITIETSPFILYTVMALANGIYISSHNALRGLSRGAVFGNFFRSILSIPIAIALNAAVGGILTAASVSGVNGILQKWAAIISKAASDCVAGVIEGFADRIANIRMRSWDFSGKIAQLFETYERLEMLFPVADVLEMLNSPKDLLLRIDGKSRGLDRALVSNALDLLYFWMYQPRAKTSFKALLKNLPEEERKILIRSQYVLSCERQVAQMFVDGIMGASFAPALAFYLNSRKEYLESIRVLVSETAEDVKDLPPHGETEPDGFRKG